MLLVSPTTTATAATATTKVKQQHWTQKEEKKYAEVATGKKKVCLLYDYRLIDKCVNTMCKFILIFSRSFGGFF